MFACAKKPVSTGRSRVGSEKLAGSTLSGTAICSILTFGTDESARAKSVTSCPRRESPCARSASIACAPPGYGCAMGVTSGATRAILI